MQETLSFVHLLQEQSSVFTDRLPSEPPTAPPPVAASDLTTARSHLQALPFRIPLVPWFRKTDQAFSA